MAKLVLWGHDVSDYQEMFDLPPNLGNSILEYGCGPTAVNGQLTALGKKIISCDNLFTLDKVQIQKQIEANFSSMLHEVTQAKGKFNFSRYGSFDAFLEKRKEGIAIFIKDYTQGLEQGRYLPIDLTLPFSSNTFDFALSSHYLFADIKGLDENFHLTAIKELARVAKEVRIFPLINRFNETTELLGPVLLQLQKENYGIEVRATNYHLQVKGNALLRVWAQTCNLP